MYMNTVKRAEDLHSSKADTIAGFFQQSIEKSELAMEYINTQSEVTRYFRKKVRLQSIKSHNDFLTDETLKEFAVAACFLSLKSLRNLPEKKILKILTKLIDLKKISNNDEDYIFQLEIRYFLTRGDSFGGTMRNFVGKMAQTKLADLIYVNAKAHCDNVKKDGKTGKTTIISWKNRKGIRTIVFDKRPRFIDKSVDFILLQGDEYNIEVAIEDPRQYLLAGELKGGIDPAGADEHWKTAKSALDRVSQKFEETNITPIPLVFLGATIAPSMAEEIFEFIKDGNYAANLTKKNQLEEVVKHIVKI